MVICLERGADLHMAQLMPLPLTVSCFSIIQIGFTFLVLAHPVVPEKGPLNGCVCVCVCVCVVLCVQRSVRGQSVVSDGADAAVKRSSHRLPVNHPPANHVKRSTSSLSHIDRSRQSTTGAQTCIAMRFLVTSFQLVFLCLPSVL